MCGRGFDSLYLHYHTNMHNVNCDLVRNSGAISEDDISKLIKAVTEREV